jgi:hypothetical protein
MGPEGDAHTYDAALKVWLLVGSLIARYDAAISDRASLSLSVTFFGYHRVLTKAEGRINL